MKDNLINEFDSLLKKSTNTLIIPHKNPDGDALGSSLELNFFLSILTPKSDITAPQHTKKVAKT